MTFDAGTVFAGYRIVRLLGSGGMGEVYLATHPRLPRNDALKVLAPHYSGNDEFRQRFSREADIASGLDHPSVVKIYDRGEADDRLWISMQYVPGIDAHDLLVAEGPMPLDAMVAISAAVGSALDHAHGHGMIHRDVKPRNILIDTTANPRRVMLADFGIARPIDETHGLTATNLTIGTMNYTSPEQISESHIDGRADQYSLACTVYELLTGAPPFVGKGVANIIHLQLNAPPPDVRQQRPDLPAGVADAIARALQKDPGRRFGSCAEFAGALVASRQPAPAVRRPAGPSSSGLSRPRLGVQTQAVRPWARNPRRSPSLDPNAQLPRPCPPARRWAGRRVRVPASHRRCRDRSREASGTAPPGRGRPAHRFATRSRGSRIRRLGLPERGAPARCTRRRRPDLSYLPHGGRTRVETCSSVP